MYGGINKIEMYISCLEITMQLHTYWLLCGGYKKCDLKEKVAITGRAGVTIKKITTCEYFNYYDSLFLSSRILIQLRYHLMSSNLN